LTFTGINDQMPDGRDAMMVQVGEASNTLRPRLWINEKSNQMVANPAIETSLLGDLYLAPNQLKPAEAPDVSATVDLEVGQLVTRQGMTVVLKRFNVREHDESSGDMTVETELTLQREGEAPIAVAPALISSGGRIRGRPADLPGGEGQVRILGLSIDRQQARVQLLGLGGAIAATHRVAKGESFRYEGIPITFERFAMSRAEHGEGQINVGVQFAVGEGEAAERVTAVVTGGMESGTTIEPAPVPGAEGVELRVNRIDADQGMVEVEVFDASLPTPEGAPMTLVLEVSRKPLVLLIWIGTLLVMAGTVIAFLLRWKDLFALSEAEAQ
jgi:cytochrome c-type biogenesis protein CcmF